MDLFAQKEVWLMVLALCLGASTLYLAFLYALNRTSLSQRIKRGGCYGCPHYRHTDVLFGSDYQRKTFDAVARGERQAWIRINFSQYGQTFELNQWGKRIFHTCDPVVIQSMLSTQFKNFGLGPSRAPSRPWLGVGIFTADGEHWKQARGLLKPIFVKTEISDMARLDKHLIRLFKELAKLDHKADLQALFLKLASLEGPVSSPKHSKRDADFSTFQYLDYSIDLLFGDDTNTLAGNSSKVDADAFIKACDLSLLQVARSQTPWLMRWYKGWTKTWDQPFRASQDFVDRHVDHALGRTKRHDSRSTAFIDELVRQTGSTDRLYLRNQMLNIFFPARDASGIAISLVMFQLARHPEVYTKVRTEVFAHPLNKGDVSYEAVKNLRYVNAVINENAPPSRSYWPCTPRRPC